MDSWTSFLVPDQKYPELDLFTGFKPDFGMYEAETNLI
jgi:hypothetical protein